MEKPARHIWVRSEDDLVRAVVAAKQQRSRLRAVGARGSKSPCHGTSGDALHLDDYDGLIDVDGNLVTVQAGMTCGKLNAILAQHDLALPTVGEWKRATVSGALLTGTHGGSRQHGIMSTSVRQMQVVTADGEILEIRRDDPLFRHVGVSLGLFGIVSTITFECVERFTLELVTSVLPFERYLAEYETQTRDHEIYSAVWIPRARSVITYAANRTSAAPQHSRRPKRFSPWMFALTAASRRFDVRSFVNDRRFGSRSIADSGDILTPLDISPRLANGVWSVASRMKATEFVVRADRTRETLDALERLFETHPEGLANAVGIRETAGDDFTLSPAHSHGGLWIDIFFHDRPSFTPSMLNLFERLDARCHWGKHIALSPGYLRNRYPEWDAFAIQAAELDPFGMFTNDFSDRMGFVTRSSTDDSHDRPEGATCG